MYYSIGRDALLRAFWVVTDGFSPNRRLQFHDFLLVMHHFRPSMRMSIEYINYI